MDINILDADTASFARAARSSAALLARLHHHHDSRMFAPPGWTKPVKPEPTPEFKELWFGMPEVTDPTPVIPPAVDDIRRAVCRYYGVTLADMLSTRRHGNIVTPRHVVMYLAKSMTSRSLPEIGRRLGGRDHTTVIHGIRKIASLIKTDWMLAYDVAQVEAML